MVVMVFITLSKHIYSNHNKKKENTILCEQCHYTCSSKANLLIHTQRIHYHDKLNCKKAFKTKADVNIHKGNVHLTDKRIQCVLCGKMFIKTKLQKHTNQLHRGIGNHLCHEFNKNYVDKGV